MCLSTKQVKAKIAKEDIVCYKILEHTNLLTGGKSYRTPYRWTIVDDEIINGEKAFEAKGKISKRVYLRREDVDYFYLDCGMIHSYKNLVGAKIDATDSKWFRQDIHIYKCIIPKGTQYYEGNFQGKMGFASKKIRFVEMVW